MNLSHDVRWMSNENDMDHLASLLIAIYYRLQGSNSPLRKHNKQNS